MFISEHTCSQKCGHSLKDRLLIRIFLWFVETIVKETVYVKVDTDVKITI